MTDVFSVNILLGHSWLQFVAGSCLISEASLSVEKNEWIARLSDSLMMTVSGYVNLRYPFITNISFIGSKNF